MLAHRLTRGFSIVPVEYRHIVGEFDGQFYQPRNGAAFVKPRGLMQELSLSGTDDLVRVYRAVLNHAPDHLPGFLSVAVIQVLPHDIAITLDCALILVKDHSVFVAHRGGEVNGVKVTEFFHSI